MFKIRTLIFLYFVADGCNYLLVNCLDANLNSGWMISNKNGSKCKVYISQIL